VAGLAARQHGVVSIAQLRSLGLDGAAVRRRVVAARLHPVHRGIYAVGHAALSGRGRLLAAVLACGPDATLSHRSAAALWGVMPATGARVDVSTPRRGRTGSSGVRLHRVRRLDPGDVGERDGIPATTVARTLVDLADVLNERRLRRVVHEAEVLRLLDVSAVDAALSRARGRRGVAALRRLLDVPAPPIRSELEAAFLDLCRHAAVPMPRVNARVRTAGRVVEVDFLWPGHGLVVEADGAAVHRTRRAFEEDRRRDVELQLAGLRVARFTRRRITDAPGEVEAALRSLLAATPPSARGAR
jgi:very-short-patch-repair endonuclease